MQHELSVLRYTKAQPFPHAVFDWSYYHGWPELIESWPEASSPLWKEHRDNKFAIHSPPPRFDPIFSRLRSNVFMRWLSSETGIEKLIYDPKLTGAGLHEVRSPGGRLGMHLDFNRLGPLYRCLNLLIYLNPEWRPEWGGCLELGLSHPRKAITPTLGTAVLFDSTRGWHGHPQPLTADAPPRRSLAVYYYTVEPPPDFGGDRETTVYA